MSVAKPPLVAALACGGPKVMVPPRIDLRQHEVLAIIEFASASVIQRVGRLGILCGKPAFAYGELVHALVELVTADFKVS